MHRASSTCASWVGGPIEQDSILAALQPGIGLIPYAVCAGNWDCARTATLSFETNFPRTWSWRFSRTGWRNRNRIGLDKPPSPALYILTERKLKARLQRS